MINPYLCKLRPKQIKTCRLYLQNFGSLRQCMLEAGYPVKGADKSHDFLKQKSVKEFLDWQQQRDAENDEIAATRFFEEISRQFEKEGDPKIKAEYAKEIRQWLKDRADLRQRQEEIQAAISGYSSNSNRVQIEILPATPEHQRDNE